MMKYALNRLYIIGLLSLGLAIPAFFVFDAGAWLR